MIVDSGNKMVFWLRYVVTTVLLIITAQVGFSQDIIFNRESTVDGSINSSQYFSQNSQQLPSEEGSSIEEKKDVPLELNLFDLTATLEDQGNDNQTNIVSVNSPNKSARDNQYTGNDNRSVMGQQKTKNSNFENEIIYNPNNSVFNDNTTNIDKLISELFPAESKEWDFKKNSQIDNTSKQLVTKKEIEKPNQQDNLSPPNVSVGLRELSGVGLVTTGIADWQQRKMPFSTLLWAGSKPENIQYLYKISEPYGSSRTINSLVYSSIIRKSAPPIGVTGNPDLSQSLVVSRMKWLARAGRSEALADFIRKLPEDEQRWDEWQRWLGAYDLLSHNDSVTCNKAEQKVSRQFDTFWLKVQILCKVIDGAYEDAIFLAELMNTSGEEDPLFFELLQNVKSRQSSNFLSTDSALTPLHLSLMDLAQTPIEWHQISELPASMMHASNLIKNTTREARLAFAMKQILQQSETTYEASALIRSLYQTERPMETAFSILKNTKGDLRLIASAEIYSALAGSMFQAEIQEDYDLLFLETFEEEVRFGNGIALLPLYADLAKTRLTTASLPPPSSELKSQLEKLVQLDSLKNTSSQDMPNLFADMNSLLQLISDSEGEKSALEILQELDLWHLIPVFEQAEMIETHLSWLKLASAKVVEPLGYENLELEPILKKALVDASENQRAAETILIISALIRNYNLNRISASDLALVIKSLQEIGFDDSANELVKEIITSYLIDICWGGKARKL